MGPCIRRQWTARLSTPTPTRVVVTLLRTADARHQPTYSPSAADRSPGAPSGNTPLLHPPARRNISASATPLKKQYGYVFFCARSVTLSKDQRSSLLTTNPPSLSPTPLRITGGADTSISSTTTPARRSTTTPSSCYTFPRSKWWPTA
jgi:hypothetical protein